MSEKDDKPLMKEITPEDLIQMTEEGPYPVDRRPYQTPEWYAARQKRNLKVEDLRVDPVGEFTPSSLVLGRIANTQSRRNAGISIAEYKTTKRMSHRLHLIAYLASAGMKQVDIASKMGVGHTYISKVMKTDRMQALVKEKAYEMFGKGAAQKFLQVLPKAIETAEKVMLDENEKGSVKADVAFRFMDRALGKPEQKTTVNQGGIRTLIERFDEFTASMRPKTVKTIELSKEKEDNSIETVVTYAKDTLSVHERPVEVPHEEAELSDLDRFILENE
jgi:hypothetical protein